MNDSLEAWERGDSFFPQEKNDRGGPVTFVCPEQSRQVEEGGKSMVRLQETTGGSDPIDKI